MLKSLNNSFSNLSKRVKIQLFILPLFLIYFFIYFFTNNTLANTNINTNNNLNFLLNKKFDKSHLDLTKEIEKYSLSKGIKLNSLEYKKENLLIKGKSSLLKINSLVRKLETINNYSNINLLSILKTQKNDEYSFEINTEFKKYYIKAKQLKNIKKHKNESVNKHVNKKEVKFVLNAIVSDYILLNNKWHSLNEEVGKYKIVKISQNNVFLKYKDKYLNLSLYKNE